MTNILFWNVQRGKALPHLSSVCLENDIDLVILAEDPQRPGDTELALNGPSGIGPYAEYAPVPSEMRFFVRRGAGTLSLAHDEGARIALREFSDGDGGKVLIAAVHLPSKVHADSDAQAYEARRLRQAIEEVERRVGHDRTIIIGDMNMNPFEAGMVAADGLYGVLDASVALRGGRVFRDRMWTCFYNPMWSRMGDESPGPSGTHYHAEGGLHALHWHSFDQVLLRPSLIPAYKRGNLSVVTRIGNTDLVSNGRMTKSVSDHLPLILRIDMGV